MLLHFTGPPECANNNGKGALNTPEHHRPVSAIIVATSAGTALTMVVGGTWGAGGAVAPSPKVA
eukprot:1176601-Pyramimonas_sp.AAC.2